MLTAVFLFRWTQISTRALAEASQSQWRKMVSEAWQRAGPPPSLATPCRACASLAFTKCLRSSTVTCWERWVHTHIYINGNLNVFDQIVGYMPVQVVIMKPGASLRTLNLLGLIMNQFNCWLISPCFWKHATEQAETCTSWNTATYNYCTIAKSIPFLRGSQVLIGYIA